MKCETFVWGFWEIYMGSKQRHPRDGFFLPLDLVSKSYACKRHGHCAMLRMAEREKKPESLITLWSHVLYLLLLEAILTPSVLAVV